MADQENDCLSCDSRIGFGTGGHQDDSNTCGNEATNFADNGDKHINTLRQWGISWCSEKIIVSTEHIPNKKMGEGKVNTPN